MRPFPFGGPGRPHRGPSSTATHPEPRSDTRRGWGVITLPTDACGFSHSGLSPRRHGRPSTDGPPLVVWPGETSTPRPGNPTCDPSVEFGVSGSRVLNRP